MGLPARTGLQGVSMDVAEGSAGRFPVRGGAGRARHGSQQARRA